MGPGTYVPSVKSNVRIAPPATCHCYALTFRLMASSTIFSLIQRPSVGQKFSNLADTLLCAVPCVCSMRLHGLAFGAHKKHSTYKDDPRQLSAVLIASIMPVVPRRCHLCRPSRQHSADVWHFASNQTSSRSAELIDGLRGSRRNWAHCS